MATGSVRTPTFPDFVPTVPEMLRRGRERFGPTECVVTPTDRLTYAALDEQSARLAARMVAMGIGKSSRVGVLLPNSTAWVLVWAAAARLGCVVVPVNTFYQGPELARFLRHADVQYLFAVPAFVHHDYVERLETIAPELAKTTDPGALYLASLPQLRRVAFWEASPVAWAEGQMAATLDEAPDDILREVVDGLGADVTPDDPMLVTYTSGSTGEPKGVVLGHGSLIRHACNLAALSGIDTGSRIWTPMPLCWVGGFAFSLLRALLAGGCFLTQEVFDAGSALATIQREQVTNVSAWPSVTKSLTEHPDFASTDIGSLRSAISFYDAMPADKKPPDLGLVVGSLGMSETCGPHTFWTKGEETTGAPAAYRGTFGHEVPGTEHRIVDVDTGAVLPEGEEGEVLVRGYSLMQGLYKRPRQEVFDADGWYHTGDRGYFRDGWFFFTGRQSDLIKTAGSNVAPAEVERAVMAFDEVKLAFVVGVAHPDREQDVVALVVPWQVDPSGRTREPPDGADLRERLRSVLSSYKVPRRVFIIGDGDVPWLISQKVDRRALVTVAEKLVAGQAEG
jgi:acyl-CoA synthetase (AMP-forming)/AMP-acid ligase II